MIKEGICCIPTSCFDWIGETKMFNVSLWQSSFLILGVLRFHLSNVSFLRRIKVWGFLYFTPLHVTFLLQCFPSNCGSCFLLIMSSYLFSLFYQRLNIVGNKEKEINLSYTSWGMRIYLVKESNVMLIPFTLVCFYSLYDHLLFLWSLSLMYMVTHNL